MISRILLFQIVVVLSLFAFSFAYNPCDSRVFNWRFYLNHNKDLMRRSVNDANSACKHWLTFGINEGRQAHPTFHVRQYCDIHSDLRSRGVCRRYRGAVEHYINYGVNEGRIGYNKNGAYGMWTLENEVFTMTASAGHAGAISSIIYKAGQTETVNSFDHGRQLQYAFTDSTGECNNPTEAGSGPDGIGDSTTSVLKDVVLSPGRYIATTTQPAYWKGPEDSCTQGRGKLSPFIVSKQVTINFNRNPHLIAYDTSFTMMKQYDFLMFECPTQYMPSEFDRIFTIDLSRRTFTQVPLPTGNNGVAVTVPIMYANGQNVAIGVMLKTVGGTSGFFKHVYFGKMGSTQPIDYTTKWSAWFHSAGVVGVGTRISSTVYVAIGTPQEVVDALASAP